MEIHGDQLIELILGRLFMLRIVKAYHGILKRLSRVVPFGAKHFGFLMASVAQVKMIVATETPCTTQMPGAKPCACMNSKLRARGKQSETARVGCCPNLVFLGVYLMMLCEVEKQG